MFLRLNASLAAVNTAIFGADGARAFVSLQVRHEHRITDARPLPYRSEDF